MSGKRKNIVILFFLIIAIKSNSAFNEKKGEKLGSNFIIKNDNSEKRSEFRQINSVESIKENVKINGELENLNVKDKKNKKITRFQERVEKKEDNKIEKRIKKEKLEENDKINNDFHEKKISYLNESLTGIKYKNKSLSGKFKSDTYINNGLEFSTRKNNLEYKGTIIKRLEGEYYNGETIRDELQIGGRIIKYYQGEGLVFLGAKYYYGESTGYYLDSGDYVERNRLSDGKFRVEAGGYYEKNGYFINGFLGQDFSGAGNKIYEDGNFKNVEIGPRINLKNKGFLIPSIEYNNEDYETYKFHEVWLKMAYEKQYDKGFISPYIGIIGFKKHKGEGENGDFNTDFLDRYKIGIKGFHKLNTSLDLTYGLYWQRELRDYKNETGSWESVFSYLNISYKFN